MADECATWEAQLKEERNKQEAEIFAVCKYSASVTARCSSYTYTAIHDDTVWYGAL